MLTTPTELTETLPAALQESVSLHWQNWCQSCETHGLSFDSPVPLSRVGRIWACSEFAVRSCTRKPHLLKSLLDAGLESDLALADYKTCIKQAIVAADDSDEAVMEVLRLQLRRYD